MPGQPVAALVLVVIEVEGFGERSSFARPASGELVSAREKLLNSSHRQQGESDLEQQQRPRSPARS